MGFTVFVKKNEKCFSCETSLGYFHKKRQMFHYVIVEVGGRDHFLGHIFKSLGLLFFWCILV